jgi:hypothetical protein
MPNRVGGNGPSGNSPRANWCCAWASLAFARTSNFQTWLIQLGMRYLTGGPDAGDIFGAGGADVKRLREVQLP